MFTNSIVSLGTATVTVSPFYAFAKSDAVGKDYRTTFHRVNLHMDNYDRKMNVSFKGYD
jgi:hypothetical protein